MKWSQNKTPPFHYPEVVSEGEGGWSSGRQSCNPPKPMESHRVVQRGLPSDFPPGRLPPQNRWNPTGWNREPDGLGRPTILQDSKTGLVVWPKTAPSSSIYTRPVAKRFLGVRPGAGRRITGLRRFLRGGAGQPRSALLPAPVGFGRRLRSRGSARSAAGRPRPAGCRRPRSRSRVRSR
jgi:hypothetical protein